MKILMCNNKLLKINNKLAAELEPFDRFKSVKIGDLYWTSPVVDVDDGGSGITTFNNYTINDVDVGTVKFYTYSAANRVADTIKSWRLPTKDETDAMVQTVGGGYTSTAANALKSTTIWSNPGSDSYGFGAIPYGFYNGSSIINNGGESTFWQSDDHYRMYILNNNTIVNGTEYDDYVAYPLRLVYDDTIKYKRFMWRWDGISSGSVFQMAAIKINDISLPYTYVTYGIGTGGHEVPNQMATRMVEAESTADLERKWCIDNWYSGEKYGWVIFDLPSAVVPTSYSLQIGGDTAEYPGRNPNRVRLYCSEGTPTTFDDASWQLLSDYSDQLSTTNWAWQTIWQA